MIADRTEKGRLLDEVVTVTGRHRKATRAIVTEYELPFELTNIHDVAGDLKGNTWFTINRHPFIGKLDPRTGKVVTYRVPDGWGGSGQSLD